MGNKWSATSPFSSEINIEEEEPPPDEEGKFRVSLTLLDSKNLSLAEFESKNGKTHTLIRVSASFNGHVYTKPVKFCSKNESNSWTLPTKKFSFSGSDATGEVSVALLNSYLPPLPAVPSTKECGNCQQEKKCAVTIGKLTIPVSVDDFKVQKHIERWVSVQAFEGRSDAQVLVALDYVARPTRVLKSGESITDKYEIESTLGTGQSVVKKAKNKENNKEYAIKFIAKQIKGQKIPVKSIDHEIELLQTLSHPNIVQLYEAFENPETVYMVMELAKGSDLYDVKEALGSLRPGLAGSLIGQLLAAVAYLHSRGIAHRDIKPENVIVDYLSSKIKLTDFGSATEFKNMTGVAGTLNYMAPELLLNMRGANNSTDQSVDIWSIGIVAYILLCGTHPFEYPAKANNNIINRIISGKFEFPENTPKPCKDFIRKCLSVDPKKRPSAAELLKHPWIISSSVPTPVNSFNKNDQERLEQENSRNNSRSNSMNSLLELFGNHIPSRS